MAEPTKAFDWRLLGNEDPCDPSLFTAGCDDEGGWIHPFIDNDLHANEPNGLPLLEMREEIRRLENENATVTDERDRLRTLFERIARSVWELGEPDGGDFQHTAEELGLIVRVPADEAFRDEWGADTMFVWAWSPLAAKRKEDRADE